MRKSNETHTNGTLPPAQDAKLAGLRDDKEGWLRTHDKFRDEHGSTLATRRQEHTMHLLRRNRQLTVFETAELKRYGILLEERTILEGEVRAAEEVAVKAFGEICVEYDADKTTVQDIHAALKLPEADAADQAGVGGLHSPALNGSAFLKWAGMAGSFTLCTAGFGAIVMHISPSQLWTSPTALLPSLGMAAMIVGGAYMMVYPTWKRAGTMAAGQDEAKAGKAVRHGVLIAAVAAASVALLDAKAIIAINVARALVDPEHATPFWVALLTGCCLSSIYVLGTASVAYHDALVEEGASRIEAAQFNHEKSQYEFVEVRQAVEALNSVGVLRRRLGVLDARIKETHSALKAMVDEHHGSFPEAPVMPAEHKADIAISQKHARFAGLKERAHNAMRRFAKDGGTEL